MVDVGVASGQAQAGANVPCKTGRHIGESSVPSFSLW